MKPNGRAIGYLRVSTDQQAESGLGLKAQEAAIRSAASRLRLDLIRVFIDGGMSGKLAIEHRPVLLEAVGALRRGDMLLVAKRDRLGRDVIAVAMIERLIAKRGARVVSAAGEGTENDDPSAMLMRRLIDSFAEYERLIISARTRAALAAKRKRGERTSPLTQKIVQTIVKRAANKAGVRAGVHILRHTFCSHLAMRGAAARAIQELAGHKDLLTTQRYMHLSPAAIESAVSLLDVPSVLSGRGDILETVERETGKSRV